MRRVTKTDAFVCLELNPHVYGVQEVLEGFETTRAKLERLRSSTQKPGNI